MMIEISEKTFKELNALAVTWECGHQPHEIVNAALNRIIRVLTVEDSREKNGINNDPSALMNLIGLKQNTYSLDFITKVLDSKHRITLFEHILEKLERDSSDLIRLVHSIDDTMTEAQRRIDGLQEWQISVTRS